LEHFEKRIQLNLKKQQAENERRQRELEEAKVREAIDRKKNIESLMVKKAEREKKQMKIRELKLAKKQLDTQLETSQEQIAKAYLPKSIHNSDHKTEYNKLNVKQLGITVSDTMLNRENSEKELVESYADHKNNTFAGPNFESKPRNSIGKVNDILKITAYQSPTHQQVINLKKSNFISPNVANMMNGGSSSKKEDKSLIVNNTRANQDSNNAAVSEFEVEGKSPEEKLPKEGSFKLPRINKTSKAIVGGKIVKSPYLCKNVLNDSFGKNSKQLKIDTVKDNAGKENF